MNKKILNSDKTDMDSDPVGFISDQRVEQLIDANLDRAREGIRVIEEWCRFALDKRDFVISLKDKRQILGSLHLQKYKAARSIEKDQGIGLKHSKQELRQSPNQIVAANFARSQEALRVLEEFGRKVDPYLAKNASEIRYSLYQLEIDIMNSIIKEEREERLKKCRLCLITSSKTNTTKIICEALEAGVKMIQYRSKGKNDLDKLNEARELSSICQRFGALLIINDRIDIALAVNADGVHLGQEDIPTHIARKLLGPNRLIGRSTHSLEEIQKAQEEGCDYLGIGPINSTSTKPDIKPIKINYLKEMSEKASLPWFAIGGINSSSSEKLYNIGAKKIAVVSAIMNSSEPRNATKKLLEIMQ